MVNWAKGEVSGRILGIPFTKTRNPLYHKKQISDNKVGVILAQIERNSVDGKNVLKSKGAIHYLRNNELNENENYLKSKINKEKVIALIVVHAQMNY